MKIFKFKTNIDRDDQVKEVSTVLENDERISKYKIDTSLPENLLSVSGEEIDPQIIKDLVEQAGYKAELVRVLGVGGEDV